MATNDKYRRDSLDGGTTWGSPYQFKGTDGQNGANGTVNYNRVNQILKETYGITTTHITEGTIGSPVIQGAEIYGGKIYAGEGGNTFATMVGGGFQVYHTSTAGPKVRIGVESNGEQPTIILGAGADASGDTNIFEISKTRHYGKIVYRDESYKESGFKFQNGGKIEPVGELSVTAVFA